MQCRQTYWIYNFRPCANPLGLTRNTGHLVSLVATPCTTPESSLYPSSLPDSSSSRPQVKWVHASPNLNLLPPFMVYLLRNSVLVLILFVCFCFEECAKGRQLFSLYHFIPLTLIFFFSLSRCHPTCSILTPSPFSLSPVQQFWTTVYQFHKWETATVLQPPHVYPGTRGIQAGGHWMDLHRFWSWPSGLYWPPGKGKPLPSHSERVPCAALCHRFSHFFIVLFSSMEVKTQTRLIFTDVSQYLHFVCDLLTSASETPWWQTSTNQCLSTFTIIISLEKRKYNQTTKNFHVRRTLNFLM